MDWKELKLSQGECDKDSQTTMDLLTQQTALTQPQTQMQAPRQRPPQLRDEQAVAASAATSAVAAAVAGSSSRHHRSNKNSSSNNNNTMERADELPKAHTLRSRPLVISSSVPVVTAAQSSSNVGNDEHVEAEDNDDDTLELAEGENWLLVTENNGTKSYAAFSLLDATQEPSQPKESQDSDNSRSHSGNTNNNKKSTSSGSEVFCSILSGVPVDREERFVCLDVDGGHLTVKDSRTKLDEDDNNNINNFTVSICRRDTQTLTLPSSWETLPRRQLRHLQVGDCLVISRTSPPPDDGAALSSCATALSSLSVLAVFEHCYDASITILTTTQTTAGTKTSTGALKDDAPGNMEQDWPGVSQLEDPEFTQGTTATCGDDKPLTQPNYNEEKPRRPAVSSPPPAVALTESKQQQQQQQQQQQETVQRKNRRVLERDEDQDETQEELVEKSQYQPVEYQYPPSPAGPAGTANVKKQDSHAATDQLREEEPLATQPENEDSDQDKSSSARTNSTADNKPSASPKTDNDVSMDDDEHGKTPSSLAMKGGSQTQASHSSAMTDLRDMRTILNDLVQAGEHPNSSTASQPRQSPARGRLLAIDNSSNNNKTTSTPAKSSPANSSAVGSDLLSPNLLDDSREGDDDDDDDADETQPVLESPLQAAELDPKIAPMTDNVATTTDATTDAAAASVHPKVGEQVDDDGDDDDDATVDPQDSVQDEHKAKNENSIHEPTTSSPPKEVSVASVENQVTADTKDDSSPQPPNDKLARRESSTSEKLSGESHIKQDSPSSSKVPVSTVEKPVAASKDDSLEPSNSKASGRESVDNKKQSHESPGQESKQPPSPQDASHDPQTSKIAGDEDVARPTERKDADVDDDDEATVDSAQLLTQENNDNASAGEKVGMDVETAKQEQSVAGSSPQEKASSPSKEVTSTLSSVEKRDAENANLSQSLNGKRARQESPAGENKDSVYSTNAHDPPSLGGDALQADDEDTNGDDATADPQRPQPSAKKKDDTIITEEEARAGSSNEEQKEEEADEISQGGKSSSEGPTLSSVKKQSTRNAADDHDDPDPKENKGQDVGVDADPQQPQAVTKKNDDTVMAVVDAQSESSNEERQQEADGSSSGKKTSPEDATASRVKKRPSRKVDLPQQLTSKRPRRGAAAAVTKKEAGESTKSQDSNSKDSKQPPESVVNEKNTSDEDDTAKPASKQPRATRGKRPGARSAPSSSAKPAPQQKPEELPIARPTPLKGKQPVGRPTPMEPPPKTPAKTPQTKERRNTRSTVKPKKTKKAADAKDEDQMAETNCIRVMCSGFDDISRKDKKTMKDLGMTFLDDINDAHTMTHLIIGDPLKRTPKVMIAMSVTSNLLSHDWLVKSGKEGKLVPCQDYIVRDQGKYSFSQSIPRGISLRKQKVGVLTGYEVTVCKGVAGKKAPALKELKCMVEAAGGVWLGELSTKTKLVDSMVILTCEKATKAQEKQTKRFEENAHVKPITWLFDTLMAQQHDLDNS